MKFRKVIIFTAVLAFYAACETKNESEPESQINQMFSTKSEFGVLPSGEMCHLYTLENANGVKMSVTDYGGIITELWVPDKEGKMGDVVLGYDSLDGYLRSTAYFGAITGRYANRIAKGKFSIDGKDYELAKNNFGNHLHGGIVGFDKVLWAGKEIQSENGVGVEFVRKSPDMEEGYPGNLDVKVTYILNDSDEVVMEYEATTDKATVVNLTNHSYWNLSGDPSQNILDHKLTLMSDHYIPVDSTLIPTGVFKSVVNTPFDFNEATEIGRRISDDDPQLVIGKGYDHCWIFSDKSAELKLGGILEDGRSGRKMKFYTTEPGVQFYSGNFLDGTITGKQNKTYDFRNALCLETEHFPDSPNQPDFPSTRLDPGSTYYSKTVFAFSIESEQN